MQTLLDTSAGLVSIPALADRSVRPALRADGRATQRQRPSLPARDARSRRREPWFPAGTTRRRRAAFPAPIWPPVHGVARCRRWS